MHLDHALQAILAQYPASAHPRSQPQFLGNAGGLSGANLWRFDSTRGPLVARAWPSEFRDRARLERIHRWLTLASDLTFVPMPVQTTDGTTVGRHRDRFWEITPWLSGAPDLSESPATEHVEAAFQGLALFHRRLSADPSAGSGPSPGLMRRLKEIEDLLRGGFDQLENEVLRSPLDVRRELALQWLGSARRFSPSLLDPLRHAACQVLQLQPCIRDARRDHFLFHESMLTGIVDFGAMDIDCVAGDLARLLGDWLNADQNGSLRVRAITAYESTGPLDPVEKALVPVFERSTAVLAPGHWVRWHFAEGRHFDDPTAVLRGIGRGLDRLERMIGGSTSSPWDS